MNKIKKLIKNEDGAAQLIEASVIYPIVFMCLFVLVYIGLYILQTITINTCAQKIALIASREVAYPGYINLINSDVYKTGTVEADFGSTQSGSTPHITCNFDAGEVKVRAYRYWSSDPLGSNSEKFESILTSDTGLVAALSLIGVGDVHADVSCENNIISQNINVEVRQELVSFAPLGFFGIEKPELVVNAVATVGDTDELIRNTDFIQEVVDNLAKKLGIDVNKMKESIKSAMDKLKLGKD